MSNKPFKSVHLTNYYHRNSGGISTAYDNLLEAANRYQRFVRLIVPGETDAVENIGEYGKIYYVKAEPFPFFDKRYRVLLPHKYAPTGSPIRKILLSEMPDMIEICDKYSISLLAGVIRKGFYCKLKPPMLVHSSCERMDDSINSYVTRAKIGKWFARRVMGNYNFAMFDFYIANSDYTAQELFDSVLVSKNPRRSSKFFNFCWQFFHAVKIPIGQRVFVNHCGVDIETFNVGRKNADVRRRILRENGFTAEDAKLLLYAGRISPEKNIRLLPEIMKVLAQDVDENYCLIIAGDGPTAGQLKTDLQKAAPGKCKFLGNLTDKEELADLYANADVFIHPNPREPFGIAPLEAMASGTPVVAPNSGGILSYATRENAWLVEPLAENFSGAIREIFSAPEKSQTKISSALQTTKQYTWEISTNRLFSFYDEMFEDFGRRRELYDYQAKSKDDKFTELVGGHLPA
ncbi:MAG: glycosyltransferase [Acidobacteriota bacterium]|nr:glycosyltransferase [Acidobacteriota bacterium]